MAEPAGWTRLEHITWRCRSPVLVLSVPRSEIEAQLGPPHVTDEVLDGIGAYDGWALRFPCGLEATLTYFQPGALHVMLHDHRTPCFAAEVFANQLDPAHLRFHLGATAEGVAIAASEAEPVPARFVVLREDDNGQTYEVARFTSRCEAEAAASAYTARAHKQTYWVAPLD